MSANRAAKGFEWMARLYPVSIGGFLLLGSLWIWRGWLDLCVPPDPTQTWAHPHRPKRLISWLFLGWLVGEIMWVLAFIPKVDKLISLRLYTMWAALTLPAFLVIAFSGGYLGRRNTAPVRLWPWRGFALFLITAAPVAIHPLRPSTQQATAADEWPKLFLKRVQAVPAGEPILFVAASGGGSRAAIFADLVLEFLLREQTAPRKSSWADHVVLISGVSGGSLGSATFVQRLDKLTAQMQPNAADDWSVRRPDLQNSVKPEVIKRMLRQAGNLSREITAKAREGKAKQYLEPAKQMLQECEDLSKDQLGANSPLDWIMQSALMDDLTADFMAPVFRGALAPGISRGQALRHFWTDQFGWGPSADKYGFGSSTVASAYVPERWPLMVFNAADVRRGSRLAVGFPPLPPKMFVESTSTGLNQGDPAEIRNGPETLADLNAAMGVGWLTRSACPQFPWLQRQFDRAKINTAEPERAPDRRLTFDNTMIYMPRSLICGVIDNSSIDTLYLIVKAMQTRAKAAKEKDDPWRRVEEELHKRRVHLVIIDSGAKPEKPDWERDGWSVVFDPLAALNNAALPTPHWLPRITSRNSRRLSRPSTSQELAELARFQRRCLGYRTASRSAGKRSHRFSFTTMDANHFLGENVLTARSLAPEDKAILLAAF